MESWGLKVAIGKHAGSSSGRYAGTIKQRLKDLQDAMDDPKVKAILWEIFLLTCARSIN